MYQSLSLSAVAALSYQFAQPPRALPLALRRRVPNITGWRSIGRAREVDGLCVVVRASTEPPAGIEPNCGVLKTRKLTGGRERERGGDGGRRGRRGRSYFGGVWQLLACQVHGWLVEHQVAPYFINTIGQVPATGKLGGEKPRLPALDSAKLIE